MSDWVKGRVVARHEWNTGLYSMRIEAPIDDFRAGQYIKVAMDIEGERVGRPYSLVNAPGAGPLEIFFNEVPEGPLTPRLSDLAVGDALWVSARAGGVFTLEAVPSTETLWMLATGTALGVYLSMLGTSEPWERFERVVLVHGVRQAADLAYSEVIRSLAAQHGERFVFVPLVSRERHAEGLGGRITERIADGSLEAHVGVRIDTEHSHLMLCGNSAMIKDVKALLEARGLRRNSRHSPGHYSTEQYH